MSAAFERMQGKKSYVRMIADNPELLEPLAKSREDEVLNSKIKTFRSQLRGVCDYPFLQCQAESYETKSVTKHSI